MNKVTSAKLAVTLSVLLSSANAVSAEHDGTATCACVAGVKADSSLPLSHPVNRCAQKQSKGVSWYSWFSGKSQSSQFHYLDLLELLTRSSNAKPVAASPDSGELGE